MHRRYISFALLLVVAAVPMFGAHAWNTYHWSKSGSQVTVPVVMNITAPWTDYDDRVMIDWNKSGVIESPWSLGSISSRRRCSSATGQIEVCNDSYGQTGWLGIAGISLSGGHIVKGYTKLNDTYFNTAKYNTPAWRRMVFCQEVGHDYGLGHVNETFTDLNTGSCMDYTNDPSGLAGTNGVLSNEYPNQHDYDMLATIYNHSGAELPFDAMRADATRPRAIEEIMIKAEQFGTPVAFDGEGRPTTFYMKTGTNHEGHDDGFMTHIFWAPVDPFEDNGNGGNRGSRDQ